MLQRPTHPVNRPGSIKELLVKARGEIAASPPIRNPPQAETVPFYEPTPINRPASRGLVLSRTVSSNTVSEVIRARTKIAAEGRGSARSGFSPRPSGFSSRDPSGSREEPVRVRGVKGTVTIACGPTQTTSNSLMLPAVFQTAKKRVRITIFTPMVCGRWRSRPGRDCCAGRWSRGGFRKSTC